MKNIKVDESKDKVELDGERGCCPYCGSEDIDYDALELEGESLYFPATCNECGNEFNEWYELEFSGHWGYPIKKKTKKRNTVEVIVDEETGQREITIKRNK